MSTLGGLGGTSGSVVTLIGTSSIESVYVPGVFSLISFEIFKKNAFFGPFLLPPCPNLPGDIVFLLPQTSISCKHLFTVVFHRAFASIPT